MYRVVQITLTFTISGCLFSLRQQEQQEKLKPVKRELRKESLKTLQSRALALLPPRVMRLTERERETKQTTQASKTMPKKKTFLPLLAKKSFRGGGEGGLDDHVPTKFVLSKHS